MPVLARVVDAALEWSVIASFTRIGFVVRRRTARWRDLEAYSLDGKVALITGATSGIGFSTASALRRMGAQVILLGRDAGRCDDARERLIASIPGPARGVDTLVASMDDAAAVRRTAAAVLAQHARLDVLVHNAGALAHGYEASPMGVESTAAAQVAGPFLLTGLLLDRLSASSGRVITVSSGGAYLVPLTVSGLAPAPAGFDGARQYARAKRAQIALTGLWAEHTVGRGVAFHVMHPGWVDTPGLREQLPRFGRVVGPLLRTPAEGADTIAWLSADPSGAASAEGLWHDRVLRPPHRLRRTRRSDTAERRARLWEWCETVTGWSIAGTSGDISTEGGGATGCM